jgi:hypothetical protein
MDFSIAHDCQISQHRTDTGCLFVICKKHGQISSKSGKSRFLMCPDGEVDGTEDKNQIISQVNIFVAKYAIKNGLIKRGYCKLNRDISHKRKTSFQ